MPPVPVFAFAHRIAEEPLAAIRAALPAIEFLAPAAGAALPGGIERARGVAISWDSPPIEAVLDAAPRIEWLHQRGAGIDRIAGPRLLQSNVVVTNGSGNHAPNIAEHVLGLMLAFARQLPALIRAQQAAQWKPPRAEQLFELSGQTLAVIGAGSIGRALGARAAALGVRVLGVRRSSHPEEDVPGFTRLVGIERLDDVLAEADHVAIALPLTGETRGLFSAARLERMKPGAYLYNVGRGGLVVHAALLEALRSGRLAGAGLDVTDPEPLPPDSALWHEPGVIVTAHSSGNTPYSFERYRALLVDNLGRWSRGEPLRNVVDVRLGY
jgi:phosphoglycerate dehydrogenase-like enzyme